VHEPKTFTSSAASTVLARSRIVARAAGIKSLLVLFVRKELLALLTV
jgi:hypothetical protein